LAGLCESAQAGGVIRLFLAPEKVLAFLESEGHMAQATLAAEHAGFGATQRRDAWWAGPLATLIGLLAFIVYGNIVLFQGKYFEIRENRDNFTGRVVAPYLAPFYSPLIYDKTSPHAWIRRDRPSWWPAWVPFSSAMLILIFPLGFRFTCYYYRKAYYRAFWADPPACAVGEPRATYWGENRWPLLIQNCHRYFMYAAVVFLVLLAWDAYQAFWWPLTPAGDRLPHRGKQFGIGLGTVLMVINVLLLAAFTFGCNSVRHLVGGRMNCFGCPGNGAKPRVRYRMWRAVTYFNEDHALWAWLSLLSVGFTDLYIRLCAMGIWNDSRLL
jgi:hypothetical protein